jgi:hypothetical protein
MCVCMYIDIYSVSMLSDNCRLPVIILYTAGFAQQKLMTIFRSVEANTQSLLFLFRILVVGVRLSVRIAARVHSADDKR